MLSKIFLCSLISAMTLLTASAQTADEIIAKHLDARGGVEKLKALQTMVMEATVNQDGTDIELKFHTVHNKGARTEYSVMGQSGYTIITPAAGWSFNPFAGNTEAQAMPADQLADAQTQLDLAGPFVDAKAKGNKIEYLGKEAVDGKDCFKLLLTRANGKKATYFLDNNYLIVKTITTSSVNGSETDVTTEYSDFRKTTDGYTVAFKRLTPNGEVNFTKIEYNVKVDDAVFKPNN